jgi:predicted dehydrogenase
MKHGFGVVGLGLIADFHARAIQAIPKAKLAACFSRDARKAQAFAGKYGCRGYSDMREFLADPDLEIVTICTPSGAHLEPAVAAAEAGRHVICEKPLEITLERCDRIIEACARRRVMLSGIFQSRFQEVSGVIKQAIDAGRFGRLVLGDAYAKWYRSQEYYDKGGWHGTLELDGGGALMNQSIHAIDQLQWFMGPVESVSAYAGTLGHERIEVEDVAVAAVHFKNGAFGVIEGTTAVHPGFLKRIDVNGTRGSAVLEETSLKAWTFAEERAEDEQIRRRFAPREGVQGGAADPAAISFVGHQRQFEQFLDALEAGKSPLTDGPEARKAVEIILAIYRSAREGKPVALPL